jgi:hypothetical protein
MKRNPNHYSSILAHLKELKKLHPTYTLGRHLSTAFDDYGDLWNVSDKELLYALEKYKTCLDHDFHHEEITDVDKIILDGLHIDRFLLDDEI